MSQVSKRPIERKTQERIWELFVACITESDQKNLSEGLITSIFTPTERIMLTKRFSIAYMLVHGYQYEDISNVLKVSVSTVGVVSRWLKSEGEGMIEIIDKIKKQEKWELLISEINMSLKELLLHRSMRLNRYIKEVVQEERASLKKPF